VTFAPGNMRKVKGLIFAYDYHDESIVGGKNIGYFEINLKVKYFCTLLSAIARMAQ
jgi:hypothetical protein